VLRIVQEDEMRLFIVLQHTASQLFNTHEHPPVQ